MAPSGQNFHTARVFGGRNVTFSPCSGENMTCLYWCHVTSNIKSMYSPIYEYMRILNVLIFVHTGSFFTPGKGNLLWGQTLIYFYKK